MIIGPPGKKLNGQHHRIAPLKKCDECVEAGLTQAVEVQARDQSNHLAPEAVACRRL
jgi:hypothetical protein